MPKYDFTSLSSQDFEELVRDLLQAEWKVSLEAFRVGRDRGIDLRYAPANEGATIIQCKHYAVSGFNMLLRHLREFELSKVERLNPSRYVIVTSVSLTPDNKENIVRTMQPFVISVRDVLGADDLEGLLSRHREIERANFKLWLTNTNVIERVLHNAELCHTEFSVDRIRRKSRFYVQSSAFQKAMCMLDQARVVVISGAPGIGKTTLAEMLIYAHLEQGYEAVVIQAEIVEGRRAFKRGAKQIFYYDDFLGQTFLGDRSEYLGQNQDVGLVDFIEMIQQSANARFILTTREHILRSALQTSERFGQNPVLEDRYILELSDYTYRDKARILYNHLYFSDIHKNYKDAMLENDFFLKIIQHQHFNPRIIEWISTYTRLRGIQQDSYQDYILRLLQNPDDIWRHAFNVQISNAARDILLCLYTLEARATIANLECAYIEFHRKRAEKYRYSIGPGDFRKSLMELDGAFLSYSVERADYINPSVREFVASVISDDSDTVEDILNSAVRFEQVVNIWKLSEVRTDSKLRELLTTDFSIFKKSMLRLQYSPPIRVIKESDGIYRGYCIDMLLVLRIKFLIEAATTQKLSELSEIALQTADHLKKPWPTEEGVYFRIALPLLRQISVNDWLCAHGGHEIYRKLLDWILEGLPSALAIDWIEILSFPKEASYWRETDEIILKSGFLKYRTHGINDEIRKCNTIDEMMGLVDDLTKLDKLGTSFIHEIEYLNERISEREGEKREEPDKGTDNSLISTIIREHQITDEEIRNMFDTLRQ
ncbi:MAG: nSTAND3 domain-containing NTPase [Leptospirillum sp.]